MPLAASAADTFERASLISAARKTPLSAGRPPRPPGSAKLSTSLGLVLPACPPARGTRCPAAAIQQPSDKDSELSASESARRFRDWICSAYLRALLFQGSSCSRPWAMRPRSSCPSLESSWISRVHLSTSCRVSTGCLPPPSTGGASKEAKHRSTQDAGESSTAPLFKCSASAISSPAEPGVSEPNKSSAVYICATTSAEHIPPPRVNFVCAASASAEVAPVKDSLEQSARAELN
mmetsp:Transcript_81208/g.143202  ORF Transcript_81208/g.143202 Transcript_81208/m.143202 type:complete len:235 (+) Transcript_81208:473-1177(+)